MSRTSLDHFFSQCTKVNLSSSTEEEKQRYSETPYSSRILGHLTHWGLYLRDIKENPNVEDT